MVYGNSLILTSSFPTLFNQEIDTIVTDLNVYQREALYIIYKKHNR